MKTRILLSCCTALAVALAAATVGAQEESPAPAAPNLESFEARVSYAIGARVAEGFKDTDFKVDVDAFVRAMRDRLDGKDLAMNDDEMQQAFMDYQRQVMEMRMAERKVQGEENKVKGDAWLAENAKQEGVQVTESGLQYKVIEPGEGDSPKTTDKVKVHYTGKLIDGTVFDSSVERGEPITFGVTQVIPGWTEALQLMKPGAKYQLFIPSNLAYGENGQGSIPPNAVLIFDVELLAIEQ